MKCVSANLVHHWIKRAKASIDVWLDTSCCLIFSLIFKLLTNSSIKLSSWNSWQIVLLSSHLKLLAISSISHTLSCRMLIVFCQWMALSVRLGNSMLLLIQDSYRKYALNNCLVFLQGSTFHIVTWDTCTECPYFTQVIVFIAHFYDNCILWMFKPDENSCQLSCNVVSRQSLGCLLMEVRFSLIQWYSLNWHTY